MSQISSIEEQDPPKQDSEPLNVFLKKFTELPNPLEQLRAAIDFMREALTQKGTPYFKGFWEVRKLCLPLFKEELVGPMRTQLWGEYIELTREGRRLKNLLDEESAFAIEQIEIAIKAIEDEVEGFHQYSEEILKKIPDIEFPPEPKALQGKYPFYQNLQRRLNLLNAYASRVNALRKELIKTEMRIRQKNKFFQRLSKLGDHIFPMRKELIKNVSEVFVKDVTSFIEVNFSDQNFDHEKVRRQVFFFREEIKTLQAIAKILTLNTHAFTTTREQLSECWDRLKGMEKELKKEFTQQKQKSAENAQYILTKIQEITESFKNEALSLEDSLMQLDDVNRWMREVELTRIDVRFLKDELFKAREPMVHIINEKEESYRRNELEMEAKKKEQVQEFKLRIEKLKLDLPKTNTDALSVELESLKSELSHLFITKRERQNLERLLKGIRDQISEKREQALLLLSDDDRATLANYTEIFEQRKQRRLEIKAQIEEYRKILGGSNLDFEKAIEYNELMTTEKERLEKIDEGIREIELKIRELKRVK